MRIKIEEEILNVDFRAKVIQEIEGPENVARKAEMKKRYEIYKDNVAPYVLDKLNEESSDKKAVNEAVNRTAGISFTREMVEKKAMVYKDGVSRVITPQNEAVQKQTEALTDLLNVNSKMKKVNKYEELFKNALVSILPYESPMEPGKSSLFMSCYQPYLYDVIEDKTNPEIARVIILSYYSQGQQTNYKAPNEAGNREAPARYVGTGRHNDGVDQIIADSPEDEGAGQKKFIWWSHKFHFTTNAKGEILPGHQDKSLLNPIGILPFYNFAKDQDGRFWALGGNDIIDACVLLNLLFTDMFYIAKYQGMGIGYMFGKGVPKNMKVGPASFVSLEVKDGDPTPQLGFATSNPPLDMHISMIKEYLMLVLLTNKLNPGNAASANNTSGIHEIIKRSENMDDIEDQREIYLDGEPYLYKVMFAWQNLYYDREALSESFAEIGKIPDGYKVKPKFKDAQVYMSEKEKLEVIEKRLMLELDTKIDAIMRDNPEMTKEEAKEKLKEIIEEKLIESSERLKNAMGGDNGDKTQVETRENSSEEDTNDDIPGEKE